MIADWLAMSDKALWKAQSATSMCIAQPHAVRHTNALLAASLLRMNSGVLRRPDGRLCPLNPVLLPTLGAVTAVAHCGAARVLPHPVSKPLRWLERLTVRVHCRSKLLPDMQQR